MRNDPKVIKLLNGHELIVNLGVADFVSVRDILEVVDAGTRDVRDPQTGEKLGTIDRIKATLAIDTVGERMSICRVINRPDPRGFREMLRDMESLGGRTSQPDSDVWPENVQPGDPVRRTNRRVKERGNN